MPDMYIDLNETIYASHSGNGVTTTAGTSDQIEFGLADMTELPGQSTWFINKVVLSYSGMVNLSDSPAVEDSYGHMIAGVAPRDVAGSYNFYNYDRFQDYLAWPLKASKKTWFAQFTPQENRIMMVHTYRPRKALLLNREQDLILCVYNSHGNDIIGNLRIDVQAKRGD